MESPGVHPRLFSIVANICESEAHASNVTVTPQFVNVMAQLTQTYAAALSRDVEAFAKHAGRKVVQVEDVKLCTRKVDSLRAFMDDYCKENLKEPEKRAGKKRKQTPTTAASNNAAAAAAASSSTADNVINVDDDDEDS